MDSNPEIALLINCIRQYVAEDRKDLLRASLVTFSNWNRLEELANRHQVVPMLYQVLRHEKIPSPFLHRLKAQYLAGALHSQLKISQFEQLTRLLESCQVKVIPWRGPVFSSVYYHDLFDRSFGDLDFVFIKSQFTQLKNCLLQEDYHLADLGEPESSIFEAHHAIAFLKKDNGTTTEFDFHWAFAEKKWGLAYPDTGVWQRLRSYRFSGKDIQLLAAEDMLLALCIHHGLRSGWTKLKYLTDLVLLLKKEKELSWEVLFARADHLGITRLVLSGMAAAQEILGRPYPGSASYKSSERFSGQTDEKDHPATIQLQTGLSALIPAPRFG